MKRVELGALTGGGFGMRVSAPGHDLNVPNAPLIFDTDTPIAFVIESAVLPATVTSRRVLTTSPPYGLPGFSTTEWVHVSTFQFTMPLPFRPFCKLGYTTSVGSQTRSFTDSIRPNAFRFEATTTSVTVTVTDYMGGDVHYSAPPVHRIAVLNVPWD